MLLLHHMSANYKFKVILRTSGSGGIRTHEAHASDLKSDPFDRSGTLPINLFN
jgi:hypothetical protein